MEGMKRYMLDTNTVSQLLKVNPAVARRVVAAPMASLCVSVVTECELLFGLAKRPDAKRLHAAVRQFLLRVDVLPFDSATAEHYGAIRASMEKVGKSLSPLDLMIAAHALGAGAVLVTGDRAFKQVPKLKIENWMV